MHTESSIVWGMLFGAIGFGYFMYGRKQSRTVPLLCGIGLFVVPWIVTGTWLLVAAGAILMALPFFIRDWDPRREYQDLDDPQLFSDLDRQRRFKNGFMYFLAAGLAALTATFVWLEIIQPG